MESDLQHKELSITEVQKRLNVVSSELEQKAKQCEKLEARGQTPLNGSDSSGPLIKELQEKLELKEQQFQFLKERYTSTLQSLAPRVAVFKEALDGAKIDYDTAMTLSTTLQKRLLDQDELIYQLRSELTQSQTEIKK